MFFSGNLKFLRKRKGISQTDFAEVLGLKRTTLSAYEIGNAEPSITTLLKMADYFKVPLDIMLKRDINKISELTIKEMENFHRPDIEGRNLRVLTTSVDSDNEENIELVPIHAKAGYTAGFSDPDYIKVLPTFQLPFLDRSKKYRSFPIEGDSMPPVSHGSYVTGEYVQNWNFIKDGFPYIVITQDEGIVFKIVYNQIQEKQSLLLCSTNPIYEPYEVPIAEISEIWKFTNYISSDMPEPNLSRDGLANTVLQLQREMVNLKNKMDT